MTAQANEIYVYQVAGEPYQDIPKDLFIPPGAFQLLLEDFAGPLDLLLYLIRRQNLDIMNIPIVMVTDQFMQYIAVIDEQRIELAADYLVMAAMLAEIKSRFLLPVVTVPGEEADPRIALAERLQQYEQFKALAKQLNDLPRWGRDVFLVNLMPDEVVEQRLYPELLLTELTLAMQTLIGKQGLMADHQIVFEVKNLSVSARMVLILERLQQQSQLEFSTLYQQDEGRLGLVVAFLAMLELAKQALLRVQQASLCDPIQIMGLEHG